MYVPHSTGGRQQRRGGDDRRPARRQRARNRPRRRDRQNQPRPGQQGWNPGGSHAQPISTSQPKPFDPKAALAGYAPWTEARAAYGRDRQHVETQYGTGQAADPFERRYGLQGDQARRHYGFDAAGEIDTKNPYGQAMLLQKSYQEGQRRTGVGMAARGQLYSGAYENAQAHGTDRYEASQYGLVQGYQGALQGVDARRTEGFDRAEDRLGEARGDAAQFVEEQRPENPAAPTRTYHPVVQSTMDQARQMWQNRQRKGRRWQDVISILGYDPRPGAPRHRRPPPGAWKL